MDVPVLPVALVESLPLQRLPDRTFTSWTKILRKIISNFAKKIMSQMLFHTLFVYFVDVVHFVHGMKNNPFDRFMVTICYNMFQSS